MSTTVSISLGPKSKISVSTNPGKQYGAPFELLDLDGTMVTFVWRDDGASVEVIDRLIEALHDARTLALGRMFDPSNPTAVAFPGQNGRIGRVTTSRR